MCVLYFCSKIRAGQQVKMKENNMILAVQLRDTNVTSKNLTSSSPSFLVSPLWSPSLQGFSRASEQWAWPVGASGHGGVRDAVRWVAGEGHGDGVACPPRHLLHAVEVLRAGREERDSSCPRFHCPVAIWVHEDKSPSGEVRAVVRQVQQ